MQPALPRITRSIFACALLAACFGALADELLDQARRLLERRQPKEAYELLLPHEAARAEIAHAHLAMGERDSARREFETVRRQAIPEDAKATIDRFLSAIAAAEVTQIAGFVELGIGHDSNVNSARPT